MTPPVRQTVRNFLPVLISRGAVQLTGYIDAMIASWLPTGAVTGLTNAQLLYTLPVSLFGISISAAELPAHVGRRLRAMRDRKAGSGAAPTDRCGPRADWRSSSCRRPSLSPRSATSSPARCCSAAASAPRTRCYVWGILAGSSIGLLATTMARLYSVAHYALGDTKRPLRFAIVRLIAVTTLGYFCAIVLPPLLGIARAWGAAGLTASAGVAGWIEFALLRASLNRRIGQTGLRAAHMARLWTAAIVAAIPAVGVKLAVPVLAPIPRGILVLGTFGMGYLAMARLLRLPIPGLRR